MKVKCSHCGKSVDASVEELEARQGHLVCPQCLSEIVIAGYAAVKPESKGAAQGTVRFCPECGERMPAAGLKFCPYCGARLSFGAQHAAVAASASAAGGKEARPAAKQPGREAVGGRVVAHEAVIDMKNYVRSYTYGQAEETKNRTHKEIVVRRWCYLAIVLLVAVFCMIMYAASRS